MEQEHPCLWEPPCPSEPVASPWAGGYHLGPVSYTHLVYDNGSVITEDKIYYNGIPATAEVFDYATQLSYLYSKEFRTNRPGTGTFTAEPISFPYDEVVFRTSGAPNEMCIRDST